MRINARPENLICKPKTGIINPTYKAAPAVLEALRDLAHRTLKGAVSNAG